ncbi:hypothetical protein KY285_008636 [Solanum tuberosum]|nr:hypothetical protein KY285_008636 [Solanum tuberosum]
MKGETSRAPNPKIKVRAKKFNFRSGKVVPKLKFGIREFVVITGLKCGLDSDFYSDTDSPNRLLAQYFPGIKQVRKSEFINAFNAKDFIEPGDVFKMALVDRLVATRICTTTPRILNWRTSDSLIYFEFLKNTMFRKYGNQIKFSNIVLTDVELADMDPSIMPESTNNQDEGIKMVREDLKDLRTKVDDHIKDLKTYIDDSMKLLIEEFRSPKNKLQPMKSFSQFKFPEGGNSCEKRMIVSNAKHPFEKFKGFDCSAELINKFVDWVYQNVSQRRNRKSVYTAVYDKLKPELDLGIVKVKKMDWFHIMVHDGRPWEDEVCFKL